MQIRPLKVPVIAIKGVHLRAHLLVPLLQELSFQYPSVSDFWECSILGFICKNAPQEIASICQSTSGSVLGFICKNTTGDTYYLRPCVSQLLKVVIVLGYVCQKDTFRGVVYYLRSSVAQLV